MTDTNDLIEPGTPLPWTAEFTDVPYAELGESWTIDAMGNAVCTLDGPADEREANARYIVEACNAYPKLQSELSALRQQAEAMADKLDTERYKVAYALQEIRKAIGARQWLSEGGRGSYTYDDERYQQEFGAALTEIEAALEPLRAIAADWSGCPTDPLRVAANREAALQSYRSQNND